MAKCWKVGHETYFEAWAVVELMRQSASCRAGEWLHAYKCPKCRAWHVGHMPRVKRRAMKRQWDRLLSRVEDLRRVSA
jgi:hypothetical protein